MWHSVHMPDVVAEVEEADVDELGAFDVDEFVPLLVGALLLAGADEAFALSTFESEAERPLCPWPRPDLDD